MYGYIGDKMEIAVVILTAACVIMAFNLYMIWVRSCFRKKEEIRTKERETQRVIERLIERIERLERDKK